MKKIFLSHALVFILSLASAHATLILSDNFNTSDAASNLNNDLGSRQSGTAANQNWSEGGGGDSDILSERLWITYGGGSSDRNVWLDYDFAADPNLLTGGQFTIAFDMDADPDYSGVFIGDGNLTGRPVVSGNDFLMIAKSSSSSSANGVSTASVGAGEKAWEFTVTTDDFDSGTGFTMDLTIDNVIYDLNGGLAGSTLSGTWDGGSQYIGFSARDPSTYIDNFAVYSVPEPSSLLLLLSAAGLFVLFKRKRA